MITTGREPALPPDLASDASPSPAAEDAPGYVETIQQRLQLTHQQMATSQTEPASNPYHVSSLIYVLHHPSRANLQVGTLMERTLSRLPHTQRVPGDLRR